MCGLWKIPTYLAEIFTLRLQCEVHGDCSFPPVLDSFASDSPMLMAVTLGRTTDQYPNNKQACSGLTLSRFSFCSGEHLFTLVLHPYFVSAVKQCFMLLCLLQSSVSLQLWLFILPALSLLRPLIWWRQYGPESWQMQQRSRCHNRSWLVIKQVKERVGFEL